VRRAKVEPDPDPRALALMLDLTRAGRTGFIRVERNLYEPLPGCEAGPARPRAGGWLPVSIRKSADRIEARIDGALLAACPVSLPVGAIGIESGLRRVQIDDLVVRSEGRSLLVDRFTHPFARPWIVALLVAACLALLAGGRRVEEWLLERTGASPDTARFLVTLTNLPLMLLPLMRDADLQPALEALRLGLTDPRQLAFSCVLVLTGLLKGLCLLSRPGIGRPVAVAVPEAVETAAGVNAPVVPAAGATTPVPAAGATTPVPAPGATTPVPAAGARSPRASSGTSGSSLRLLLTPLVVQLVAAVVLADTPHRLLFIVAAGLLVPGLWIAALLRLAPTGLSIAHQRRIEGLVALEMVLFALLKAGWQWHSSSGLSGLWLGRNGAWTAFALGALAVQLVMRLWILNLNAAEIRHANAGSLVLVAGLLVTGEAAARASYLDLALRSDDTAHVVEELQYLTRVRQPRAWPDRLFPVAFPARARKDVLRVVCMGGSSTAGAYQMHDLKQFYPYRLERRLNDDGELQPAEVLNQGVGGWNTLHIRHYLEESLPRLAPDLLTLYVGHNDILTPASVPYRKIWDQLEGGRAPGTRLQALLGRVRLFTLLSQALTAMRDRGGQSAVPVSDARSNVTAIVELVQRRGGRVLLMSEALNPDPLPLEPYHAMLAEVASATGAAYLDTARLLWLSRERDLFLDDCHLSERGHQVLAVGIYGYLKAHPALVQRAR
jgi:lysophospholipase L1-like esterase